MSGIPFRPMTLRELVAQYPGLFRQDQTWWRGEAFVDAIPERMAHKLVFGVRSDETPAHARYSALEIAHAYVAAPRAFRFRRWLWTTDFDRDGQRVFVGVEDGRFEIHRHLHLTARFGVPA